MDQSWFHVVTGICGVLGVVIAIYQAFEMHNPKLLKYRVVKVSDTQYSIALWNASKTTIKREDILFLGFLSQYSDQVVVKYTNDNIGVTIRDRANVIINEKRQWFIPVYAEFIARGTGILFDLNIHEPNKIYKIGFIGRINNENNLSVSYFRTPVEKTREQIKYFAGLVCDMVVVFMCLLVSILLLIVYLFQKSFSPFPIIILVIFLLAGIYYIISIILPAKMPIDLYKQQKGEMRFWEYRKKTLYKHSDFILYPDLTPFYKPERGE